LETYVQFSGKPPLNDVATETSETSETSETYGKLSVLESVQYSHRVAGFQSFQVSDFPETLETIFPFFADVAWWLR
jgi:hypothetical protein